LENVKVLDSSALIAYFEGEPSGKAVSEILKEFSKKSKALFLSVVNWGEVLYIIERRHGLDQCNEIEHLMEQMCVEVVSLDKDLTRQAARIRVSEKLPYGDCFAAALAINKHAELVTKDTDFKAVQSRIRIQWI
jgi:predicted nucleic acid-binding protein